MFDLYDNAGITVCGAFCALMEFKRASHLPFTTITKLLDLLQLLCPSNNNLPTSVYKLRKKFHQFSSSHTKHYFCHTCHTKFTAGQNACSNCELATPDTLITIDPKKAIARVKKVSFCTV